MRIESVVSEFMTGQGTATGTRQPIGSRRLYKGVHVRSDPLNAPTMTLYVGPVTVGTASGYVLLPGSEVHIEVDDLSKVYVLATDTNAADEEQSVTMADAVGGDRYRLTFNGETTDWLWVGDIVATVQVALEALSTIGAGNVLVGGTSLIDGPIKLTFQGDLAGTDVPLVLGEGGTSEIQEVAIDPMTTGGTLTLTFGGETTGPLAYDAAAADVQTALEALSTIGADNVEVTGGPGPIDAWAVTFRGDLAAQPVDLLVGDGSLLTGGATTDVTVTEATPGESKTITVQETKAGGPAVSYSWLAQ